MVARLGEVLAEAVNDRIGHDGRKEAPKLFADTVKGVVARVHHGDVVAVLLRKGTHAIHQWARLIFPHEQNQACVLFDEFERTVEELRGVDPGGPQPLHFLQHAH
ncbi:hypothetical protein [Paenarthrobacter sp. 22069]|uniref:hypothetical protein n=1 Tax=Paenarthrobacter sp. 22069 TaxID=3453864 RepID=UPI003F84A927